MANFLALLAFSGLIAPQFMVVVFACQYRMDSSAPHEPNPHGAPLIHRAA
jgi:hypothetical protein